MTVWEVLSGAQTPFADFDNSDALCAHLRRGGRLRLDQAAAEPALLGLHALLDACWQLDVSFLHI